MENQNMELSDFKIQWHPAFCAAAELEFLANRGELEFQREYNLSKKPLQIDLLVVEKLEDVVIQNEIGRIFRRYNVIEYKSPGDGMTIDDFFKTVGYAYIYKGLGERVDQIRAEQLTVSLFREEKPEELLRRLEGYGLSVKAAYKGIYYVEGLLVPAQIVVTGELEGKRHRSLKLLSRSAQEEDIVGFVEEAQRLSGKGERANADAVLQASVMANYGVYSELKRRYPEMCEAMRMLMREEIEADVNKARQDGIAQGKAQGETKGKRDMALSLAGMGIPVEKIAEAAKVSVKLAQEWIGVKENS